MPQVAVVILHDLLTRGDGDPLEIEKHEQRSHLTVGDGLKPYVRASDVERRLGRMLEHAHREPHIRRGRRLRVLDWEETSRLFERELVHARGHAGDLCAWRRPRARAG